MSIIPFLDCHLYEDSYLFFPLRLWVLRHGAGTTVPPAINVPRPLANQPKHPESDDVECPTPAPHPFATASEQPLDDFPDEIDILLSRLRSLIQKAPEMALRNVRWSHGPAASACPTGSWWKVAPPLPPELDGVSSPAV